ncbi:MAG TPA: LPS assembly protein LptD [Thermoanaerobaculia bacterium]|nr:LPS assembly protein LptD [Thermoanaerobaculia bacterium]
MLDTRRPLTGLLIAALCLTLPASGQEPAQPQAQPLPAQATAQTTAPAQPAEQTAQPMAPPTDPAATPPATPVTPPTSEQQPDSPSVPPMPPQTLPEPQGGGIVPPAVPAVPGAGPDRIEFNLNFPADQGGGSAAGSAGSLEYQRDDYAVLSGGVRIRYQDVNLQAEQAEIDLNTKIVTARGNVVIDQGPRRLSGDTANYDLDTKTGRLTNATANVSQDYYFSGSEVAKISDTVYTVEDGVFTSCSQEVPDWSSRLGSARVEEDQYAHVRNASMRAKKLPVFYTPYILWPVKPDRSSGFLIPNIGYSDRRGASVGLAYFQTLGRSYDTTFHVDTYTESYLGLGNEFRYRPSEGTRGNLLGYVIRDPESVTDEEWRWKLEWNHETRDLWRGMRAVVAFQDYSDFNFFQDFERDFDRNTRRFIDSRAFVTGNWGAHLFTLLLNDRQTFVNASNETLDERRLPELDYTLRRTRIGRTPLYMQFDGSASYLDIDRPNGFSGSYGRLDLFPQLSLPVRSFPWLSLTLTGGGRVTYYQDTVDLDNRSQLSGESLLRALPSGTAEIVGPSFSRIFDLNLGSFGRFKHVVEPRWTYNYLGEFEEENEVPLFDEVDTLRSTNSGRFVFANRILGKPREVPAPPAPPAQPVVPGQPAPPAAPVRPVNVSAREVLYFEVSRRYSFDSEQPLEQGLTIPDDPTSFQTAQAGPLEALLRFNPSDRTSVKLEADYSMLFSGLSSTSLSGNYGFRKNDTIGLTWFTRFQPRTGEELDNQVRLTGGLELLPNKLRLDSQINYSLTTQLLQQQIYALSWSGQCYGVRVEMRDFRAGAGDRIRDKDFRFSLSLKNVGTFLDLTSRSSTSQEP